MSPKESNNKPMTLILGFIINLKELMAAQC